MDFRFFIVMRDMHGLVVEGYHHENQAKRAAIVAREKGAEVALRLPANDSEARWLASAMWAGADARRNREAGREALAAFYDREVLASVAMADQWADDGVPA